MDKGSEMVQKLFNKIYHNATLQALVHFFFPWRSDLASVNGESGVWIGSNFNLPNAPFWILKFQILYFQTCAAGDN